MIIWIIYFRSCHFFEKMECNECGTSFKTKKSLKSHMRYFLLVVGDRIIQYIFRVIFNFIGCKYCAVVIFLIILIESLFLKVYYLGTSLSVYVMFYQSIIYYYLSVCLISNIIFLDQNTVKILLFAIYARKRWQMTLL